MNTLVRRARLGRAAAIILVVVAFGACQPGRPGRTTTTGPAGPAPRGRYAQPVFSSIEQVARSVTYEPADARADRPTDLRLDAWAPAGDTATRRPAIVWGFGGAFIFGTRSQVADLAQDSARRGYVGVTIDYRLRGSATNFDSGIVPAYLDTVAAGQWLKANADRYGIDPDAIVVAGVSAGAMNAINSVVLPGGSLLAFPSYFQVRAGTVNPQTSPYAAAISNSGAAAGPMARPPLVVSRSGQAPILMLAGTADAIVSYPNWQVPTCSDHKAKGNVCELVTYAGGTHTLQASKADVLNRAAAFVKQQVLIPRGYPAD